MRSLIARVNLYSIMLLIPIIVMAKLLSKTCTSVPFTPVDKRIIGPNCKSNSEAYDLISYTNEQKYSSLHALYVDKSQREIFKSNNFIERLDCNYKWVNRSYDFDAFCLNSPHDIENIKKERAYIQKLNIEFEYLTKITKRLARVLLILCNDLCRQRTKTIFNR